MAHLYFKKLGFNIRVALATQCSRQLGKQWIRIFKVVFFLTLILWSGRGNRIYFIQSDVILYIAELSKNSGYKCLPWVSKKFIWMLQPPTIWMEKVLRSKVKNCNWERLLKDLISVKYLTFCNSGSHVSTLLSTPSLRDIIEEGKLSCNQVNSSTNQLSDFFSMMPSKMTADNDSTLVTQDD